MSTAFVVSTGRSHPLSGGGASGSLVEGVAVLDPTVGLGRPLDEAASDAAVVLADVGLGALSGVVLLLFRTCSDRSCVGAGGDVRLAVGCRRGCAGPSGIELSASPTRGAALAHGGRNGTAKVRVTWHQINVTGP